MKKIYKMLLLCSALCLSLNGLVGQDYIFDTNYGTSGKTVTPQEWLKCHFREACITSAGEMIMAGDVNSDSCILIKYDADGKIDNAFGSNGYVKPLLVGDTLVENITGMVLQEGNIVLSVVIKDTINYLMRFTSNGSVDNTFDADGTVAIKPVNAKIQINQLASAPSDKYMVTGSAGDHFLIARYNHDGTLDNTLDGTGVITEIHEYTGFFEDIVVMSDGSFIAGGSTSDYMPDPILAKFDSEGSLVSGFGGTGVVVFPIPDSYDFIIAMIVQSDGKLLVTANSYEEEISDTWSIIVRLNTNGTPDESFGEEGIVEFDPTWWYDKIMSLALQPDNKILAGGYKSAAGDQFSELLRYKTDGSIDESFAEEGILEEDFGAYDYIADIFCVSDDKIIMVARSASDFWAIRIMEPGGTIPSGIETQLQEQVEINLVRNRVIVCSTDLINGQVRVADLSGRTLQLREINHTQQFEMDLNHLTRGIYFVTVYTGNKNHTKKIFLKD